MWSLPVLPPDAPLVSRQLQYLGIMETVKMRREGYPHRVEFKRFYNTYNGCVNMFSGSEFSKGHLKVLCDALKEKSIQMVQRSGKKVGASGIRICRLVSHLSGEMCCPKRESVVFPGVNPQSNISLDSNYSPQTGTRSATS